MKVRLSTEPNGDIALQSPYDADFVAGLKAALPCIDAAPAERKLLVAGGVFSQ